MSNVDSNVTLTKKKRKKRRKRNPSIISSQPTVSPVNTIAALFKLQQKLTNKYISNQSSKDKPLMSGPRFRPQMKWMNPLLTCATLSGPRFQAPHPNHQKIKNIIPNIQEKSDTTVNPQSSEPGPSQTISDENKTKYPQKLKIQANKSYNQKLNQNEKFHDCKIYDSPSFINFESDEGMTDLNDDDICNKNLGTSVISDRTIINKPDMQISFKTKLQQQDAKKFESRPQMDSKSKQYKEITDDTQTLLLAPSLVHKTANQELIDALSSDINTVVRDKLKTTPYEQNKYQFHEQQIHIPGYVNATDTPTSVQMSNDRPIFVQTDNPVGPQAYSPTDIYTDMQASPDPESHKRLSAFRRLGPIQRKKSRLTVVLGLDTDRAFRDGGEETEKYKPTRETQSVAGGKDSTREDPLPHWPWDTHSLTRTIKSVTTRTSKTVMMIEKEYMEEIYDRDAAFILLSLEGYPENWTKENVLDLILEHLKDKHFIPCFIEFTTKECKFFVIRSKGALSSIHCTGFAIHKDNIEIKITISQTALTLRQINFIPRLVLGSRLASRYDGQAKLDLSEFTLEGDVSRFMYFPLRRVVNQTELVQLQAAVSWEFLTELDLSRNRLNSIEGFCLEKTTPRLKILDLSYNCIESVLTLTACRHLHLIKITLEGNPLCNDYIESDHYVRVLKAMFSSLRELDGVEIVNDSLPRTLQNYCPENSRNIVEKFLEVFFPLLECVQEERKNIQSMYADNALMTVTHKGQLRYNTTNKLVLNLLIKSRILLDGDFDHIQGRSNIVKLIKKWPLIQHDASTFTVDVIYSTETSIIFTINGIFKITSETLAQDETLLSFTRTITLMTDNGFEYNISNEMIYFDEPYKEWEKRAFRMVMIPKKILGLKLESPLDEDIKTRLVHILMKVTSVDKKQCESYLLEKNWNFREALELFIKVFK